MLIRHLSTTHTGGAGIAARRLNESLNGNGVHSEFFAIKNSSYSLNDKEFIINRNTNLKLKGKINSYFANSISNEVFFSLQSTDAIKLDNYVTNDNTILHLHNWFNLVSLNNITRFLQKRGKLVLTLHDERLLTGGCHYVFDCSMYRNGCKTCPKLPRGLNRFTFREKNHVKKLLELISRENTLCNLIVPSKWLLKRVIDSNLVDPNKILFVPNSLGKIKFQFHDRDQLSHSSKIVIGFAALQNSFLKGFDLLEKLRLHLRKSDKFIFVNLNESKDKELFWKKIDILFVPSRLDNSPNVIHEAKIRGIPIVASDVGGITELMNKEFDRVFDVRKFDMRLIESFFIELKDPKHLDHQINMKNQFAEYTDMSTKKHIEIYNLMIEK